MLYGAYAVQCTVISTWFEYMKQRTTLSGIVYFVAFFFSLTGTFDFMFGEHNIYAFTVIVLQIVFAKAIMTICCFNTWQKWKQRENNDKFCTWHRRICVNYGEIVIVSTVMQMHSESCEKLAIQIFVLFLFSSWRNAKHLNHTQQVSWSAIVPHSNNLDRFRWLNLICDYKNNLWIQKRNRPFQNGKIVINNFIENSEIIKWFCCVRNMGIPSLW